MPALLRWGNSTNEEIREECLVELTTIHAQTAAVVSVLIESLHDKSAPYRATAAGMLGEFGEDAKPAVPQLVQALKDESEHVRGAAAHSLKIIDAEAAAKAGVQ